MNTLYQKIDEIAVRYDLSPCAMPDPRNKTNIAWIKTGDWPAEARAALARIAAKQFTPKGYYYIACESINPSQELCGQASASP